ncbi:succinate-acetate transporter protein [Aequitasia blattaphilus]|uniref:Acetate uptake transporter n=1 Tax=Aequitasia blattaphilus TaxID=2949332 RepID=A0ABT1EBA6_9FIRM|nr:acetate uptake transporter [Aequitasia blattaphilus]MCP1101797.1 acetate uptake transporter [Aequitasia blattaphilus]MCR8614437.1 acetate uptake transporter [Aequitasia blattaphilus]
MEKQVVEVKVADPSAIGLFGLAMVTLVASSQKLGITSEVSYVLPVAIFLGGLAQLYASFSDSKLNNTFGSTAFGAYGFFWLVVASDWLIKYGVFGKEMKDAIDMKQMGFLYVGYLIFTLFMTYGAAGTHKVLFSIFVLIDFLFLGLSMSSFEILPEFSHTLAAYSELLIALFSFYGSGAAVLNAHYNKVVLPVGKAIIQRG